MNNIWNNALEEQQRKQQEEMMQLAYDEQRKSFEEMSSIHNLTKQNAARRQVALANDIAGLVKYARDNGGQVPEDLREWVNQRNGFDGVSSGILPMSGFNQDGDFVLNLSGGLDSNKQPIVQGQVFSPVQQYQMMNMNRAVFNDNDRTTLRDYILSHKPSELTSLDNIDKAFAFTPRRGTSVPSNWLMEPRRSSSISAFSADGKGGFTRTEYNGETGERTEENYGTRDPNEKGQWKVLRSGYLSDRGAYGSDYENSKTGERVFVGEGETAPWMKDKTKGSDKMAIAQIKADATKYGADVGLEKEKMKGENAIKVAQIGADNKVKVEEVRSQGGLDKQKLINEGNVEIAKLQGEYKTAIADKNFELGKQKLEAMEKQYIRDHEIAKGKLDNDAARIELDKEYNQGRLEFRRAELGLKEREIANRYEVALKNAGVNETNANANEAKAKADADYKAALIGLAWDKQDLEWAELKEMTENNRAKRAFENEKQAETNRRNKALEDIARQSDETRFDIALLNADTKKYLGVLQNELKEQGITLDKKELAEIIRHNQELEKIAWDKNKRTYQVQVAKITGAINGKSRPNEDDLKIVRHLQSILNGGGVTREQKAYVKEHISDLLEKYTPSKEESKTPSSGGDNGNKPLTREEKIAEIERLKKLKGIK